MHTRQWRTKTHLLKDQGLVWSIHEERGITQDPIEELVRPIGGGVSC